MNTLVYIAFLLVALFKDRGCFEFTENSPGGIKEVPAINSGEAVFQWHFRQGDAEDYVKIECGYIDPATANIVVVVTKNGINNLATVNSGTSKLSGRVQVYTANNDSNMIGFKITRVKKDDPKRYKCKTIFVLKGSPNIADTKLILVLSVFDPPNFDLCLKNIFQPINVKDVLDIECTVTGNPLPYLQCLLLDEYNRTLQRLPNLPQPRNLSRNEDRFTNLPKQAESVRCIASTEITGTVFIEKKLTVRHAPFAPSNFSQITSNSTSAINVQWLPLTLDDAGNVALTRYEIRYFLKDLGQSNISTLTLAPSPSSFSSFRRINNGQNGFYTYEIKGLSSNLNHDYIVFMSAVNSFGNGDFTERKEMRTGFNPPALPLPTTTTTTTKTTTGTETVVNNTTTKSNADDGGKSTILILTIISSVAGFMHNLGYRSL